MPIGGLITRSSGGGSTDLGDNLLPAAGTLTNRAAVVGISASAGVPSFVLRHGFYFSGLGFRRTSTSWPVRFRLPAFPCCLS
jgi:hypothetical protein